MDVTERRFIGTDIGQHTAKVSAGHFGETSDFYDPETAASNILERTHD